MFFGAAACLPRAGLPAAGSYGFDRLRGHGAFGGGSACECQFPAPGRCSGLFRSAGSRVPGCRSACRCRRLSLGRRRSGAGAHGYRCFRFRFHCRFRFHFLHGLFGRKFLGGRFLAYKFFGGKLFCSKFFGGEFFGSKSFGGKHPRSGCLPGFSFGGSFRRFCLRIPGSGLFRLFCLGRFHSLLDRRHNQRAPFYCPALETGRLIDGGRTLRRSETRHFGLGRPEAGCS